MTNHLEQSTNPSSAYAAPHHRLPAEEAGGDECFWRERRRWQPLDQGLAYTAKAEYRERHEARRFRLRRQHVVAALVGWAVVIGVALGLVALCGLVLGR